MSGAPLMRALVYEFQDDPNLYDESFTFLLGRDLLVAGVLEPGARERTVYLPAGCRWYDVNDDYACYDGGQTVTVPADLATIPRFVREGAILPTADNPIRSMERDRVTALHLLLAPGVDRDFVLYDDDGVSNDFQKGVWRKTAISMRGWDVVTVDFRGEGSWRDPVETVTVEMLRRDRSPYRVDLGGERLAHFLSRRKFESAASGWYYSQTKRAVLVKYPNPKRNVTLTVSFAVFDLIGMG